MVFFSASVLAATSGVPHVMADDERDESNAGLQSRGGLRANAEAEVEVDGGSRMSCN